MLQVNSQPKSQRKDTHTLQLTKCHHSGVGPSTAQWRLARVLWLQGHWPGRQEGSRAGGPWRSVALRHASCNCDTYVRAPGIGNT